MLQNRIRQALVLVFAVSEWIAAFWVGNRLNQDARPDGRVYFLPVDFTFAIWGVIFTTSLLYAIYQALPAQTERPIHRKVGWLAAANMALCSLWLIVSVQPGEPGSPNFQPVYIAITVLIIIGMLVCMTLAMVRLRAMQDELTRADRWLVQVPMSIYFAWLNVATIANTTAALIAYNITGEPYGATWAATMIGVAVVLVTRLILYLRKAPGTVAFALVVIWALFGIYLNNTQRSGLVAGAAVAGMAIIALVTVFRFVRELRPSVRQTATYR